MLLAKLPKSLNPLVFTSTTIDSGTSEDGGKAIHEPVRNSELTGQLSLINART